MGRLGSSTNAQAKGKTIFNGAAAGAYAVEILDAKLAERRKYESTEMEDVLKLVLVIVEGAREQVYPNSYPRDHDDSESNFYGFRCFWDVTLFFAPGDDGSKPSNLYKLVSNALFKGKPIPQEKIDYWADPSVDDAEAQRRLEELATELKGAQISATLAFRKGAPGKSDNNKVTDVTVLRKKLPAYERVDYALTPEQIADANPAIVDENKNVFYGFYGSDGTLVTQAEWREKCVKNYGGVFSQAKIAEIKAQREAEKATAPATVSGAARPASKPVVDDLPF